METEKKEKIGKRSRIFPTMKKIAGLFLRWFFLLVIVASAGYAVLIWRKYILNADWGEEKKKAYVSEQSVLSFDSEKYKKALETVDSRQKILETSEKFSGRDIFFPDGF